MITMAPPISTYDPAIVWVLYQQKIIVNKCGLKSAHHIDLGNYNAARGDVKSA